MPRKGKPTEIQAVLDCGEAWRQAQVAYGAVVLGMRKGDERAAKEEVDNTERQLMIALDRYRFPISSPAHPDHFGVPRSRVGGGAHE